MLASTTAENARAALVCTIGMGGFAVTDALSKSVVTTYGLPVLEMLTLRACGMSLVLSCTIAIFGPRWREWATSMTRRDILLLAARSALEALSSWLFNLALIHMPMSQAIAIAQALPLVVMLGAACLGEHVTPVGWLAAFAGFVGVLIIVRPSPQGLDLWSLCALAAVLCMAVRDLGTRSLSGVVPSIVVTQASAFGLMAFGLGSSWVQRDGWRVPSWSAWGCLGGAAFSVSVAFFSSASVMRSGSVAFVQPFRYTLLLWAMAFGWLFFGETPDGASLVGGMILVLAAYATVRSQHQRAVQQSREWAGTKTDGDANVTLL